MTYRASGRSVMHYHNGLWRLFRRYKTGREAGSAAEYLNREARRRKMRKLGRR
jgi:hypothetical protein